MITFEAKIREQTVRLLSDLPLKNAVGAVFRTLGQVSQKTNIFSERFALCFGWSYFYMSPREDENGNKYIRVKGVRWFTNIDHGRRHEPLQLMTMAKNFKHSKHKEIRGQKDYVHYENYDAIDIPFTDAIPSDYEGAMGVPITFLDKYCPEQFEIIGHPHGDYGLELGLKPYPRELKELNKGLRDGDLYYMKDGKPELPYRRILIRKKQSV